MTITKDIDDKFGNWFPFENFNEIQQQALPHLLNTDRNIVISAPTGSGKTTLFELAMIRLLKKEPVPVKKILYLSPMRALCTEKAQLWSAKFERIGKRCVELIGGDSNSFNSNIEDADLIITTPEKWDYITRSDDILKSIGLILIDEVHILNDKRGAVLEAIISRMRLALKDSCRIIAVSATIPNVQNIAQWFRSQDGNHAKVLQFPDSMRPVPLKTHVISVPMNGKNGYTFDYSLNYKLPDILSKYSDNKPSLIFCSTRKSTIKTVEFLGNSLPDLPNDQVELEDKHLKQLIETKSLAYHHAGLSSSDRETVEQLFRYNKIKVLCSTSTLAIGVNLPSHLVIIKSTLQYTTGSGYTEYSNLDLRQMIGRAGRAGYDSHGVAVILTSTGSEQIYRSISEGKLEIDSQLLPMFIEFLNVEVSNGNIKTFSQAMEWLSYTYLFVRMQLNPTKYSLKTNIPLKQQLQYSMDLYLKELAQCGVIDYDAEEITTTRLGQAMARNFIKLKSLKELQKINLNCINEISGLLRVLSQNFEVLSQVDLKSGDKVLIHKVINDPSLIYPLTGKSNWESWRKSFIFIQIALQSELVDYNSKLTPIQREDLETILDQSCRLLKFIIEMAAQKGIGLLLRNALEILSSLRGRSWHSNHKLLQQVSGIGQVGSKTLFCAGLRSINDLKSCDASRLEILLKRNPPFGHKLKKLLESEFPSVKFECNFDDESIKMSLRCDKFESEKNPLVHLLVLAYTSETSCRILLYEQFPLHLLPLNRLLNVSNCQEKSFSCSLMFEDWAGLNQNICFDVANKEAEVKKDEFDLLSEIDFNLIEEVEQNTADLNVTPNLKNLQDISMDNPPSPISTKSLDSPKCKHPCKDKFNCAHVCCKVGLLVKRPSSQLESSDSVQQQAKRSNFLSSTRRSLTNAREYLRKYQPFDMKNNCIGSGNCGNLIPIRDSEVDLCDEIEFVLRYPKEINLFDTYFTCRSIE